MPVPLTGATMSATHFAIAVAVSAKSRQKINTLNDKRQNLRALGKKPR